jgi:hypothetical protein
MVRGVVPHKGRARVADVTAPPPVHSRASPHLIAIL